MGGRGHSADEKVLGGADLGGGGDGVMEDLVGVLADDYLKCMKSITGCASANGEIYPPKRKISRREGDFNGIGDRGRNNFGAAPSKIEIVSRIGPSYGEICGDRVIN